MSIKSLLCSFLISCIPALGMQDINSFVEKAFEKNQQLKSLENAIKVSKEQIALSSKYSNPVLNFGATDIWLSDISNRDSEPMQAYYLGLSQKIPLSNKLKTKESIANNDLKISKYKLEKMKLEFKSNISLFLYNIALLENRISLYTKLETNIYELEKFLNELFKYNRASQTQIINTQVLAKEIKLKKIELYNLLKTQTLNLERITYSKYEDANINLEFKKPMKKDDFSFHPEILSLEEEIKKYKNIEKYEQESKNSDINVSLTYFKRDSKFEDYVNLGFAIPLSVYDKENIKIRKAKHKSAQLKNSLEDLKYKFKNETALLLENMSSAQKSFSLMKNEIIPKLNELQKNLQNYNSFSKVDSSALIKNMNEILKYEIKAINEKHKYFSNLAKFYYFSKDL